MSSVINNAPEKRKIAEDRREGSHAKKPRYDHGNAVNNEPRKNRFTGQSSAFPGLDDSDSQSSHDEDEELNEEARETKEALKYLRAVRSEAAGIPDLLVASRAAPAHRPNADCEDGGEGNEYEEYYAEDYDDDGEYWEDEEEDTGGFYANGAYIAYPQMGPMLPSSNYLTTKNPLVSAQAFYHTSLLSRYKSHRRNMSLVPSSALNGSNSSPHLTHVDYTQPKHKERKRWAAVVLNMDPRRVKLAKLDTAEALWILESIGMILRRTVYQGDGENWRRIGAWIWGLFGKVAEYETMGSEEVAILRDLGKTAVHIVKELVKGIYSKNWKDEPQVEGEGRGQEEWNEELDEKEVDEIHEDSENGDQHDGSMTTVDATSPSLDGAFEKTIEVAKQHYNQGHPPHDHNGREKNSYATVSIEGANGAHSSEHQNARKPRRQETHVQRRRNSSSVESDPLDDQPSIANIRVSHYPIRREAFSHGNLHSSALPSSSSVASPMYKYVSARSKFGDTCETSPRSPSNQIVATDCVLGRTERTSKQKPVVQTESAPKESKQVADGMFSALDVILTVVGECYGQKDLLWARDELWDFREDGHA